MKHWDEAFTPKDFDSINHEKNPINLSTLELFDINPGKKRLAYTILFLDWIGKITSIFHIIPSYNLLDAMPIGWRKSFGIKMCEEIKQELIKYNYLYKYRIYDIKEKYGSLRWYDGGYPKDSKVGDIIDKYEELSARTCIVCGKKAVYETIGWISPYCEDCVPKDRKYIKIEDEDSRIF